MSRRFGTQRDRFKEVGDENATMWISAGESLHTESGISGMEKFCTIQSFKPSWFSTPTSIMRDHLEVN